MELLNPHLVRLAKMPGEQIQSINANIQKSCKEEEALKIQADRDLRTTQAAHRQIENLCNLYST